MTRRLLPWPAADLDPRTAYDDLTRHCWPDRPYVVLNMVASVDGAVAIDGVTKELGSRSDRLIFHHLRELADAVMAGASTVRAEHYGPVQLPAPARAQRLAQGRAAQPPLVVVSRSLAFDWEAKLFTCPKQRPILLVPADAPPARRTEAERVAEVICAGTSSVDLPAALGQLRARRVALLVCEGGPTLNSALLGAGLVDELCLTVSPLVTATTGPLGIFAPLPQTVRQRLQLVHVLEEDGFLYLRYRLPAPLVGST